MRPRRDNGAEAAPQLGGGQLCRTLETESFLEAAFLRWVLEPALLPGAYARVRSQEVLECSRGSYRLDFTITGDEHTYVVELDGFEFHRDRFAFTYDRLRQNDIHGTGRIVIRFSYDAVRREARRCVEQLQEVLRRDRGLAPFLDPNPTIEQPAMDPDPMFALHTTQWRPTEMSDTFSFDFARARLSRGTLRTCQREALEALANYYRGGGRNAACVMSVGAGKTALGVAACLAFAGTRAMIVTPGRVIRGTFARALDPNSSKNVLYTLPKGPLLPGCPPPNTLTLDRDDGPIKATRREELLAADVLVTNFHSLGTGEDENHLLAKLRPDDIDFIVVDEAHIAASDSYQRCFRHFSGARTLLMSACFSRLDGKPIDADIVYRYRLIDSIVDGHAKTPHVRRFQPQASETIYEMVWPDGAREEIVGRDAMLELLQDEKKLARVTAKSTESIEKVLRGVREALDRQAKLLNPVKPRVLFSALGHRHAEQIARLANEYGIPCELLHHSMTESRIRSVRKRYEQDSGDLQGIVQLKMLGQGYDLPAISVVVPMRPYGSFSEFYQFIGRGIRAIHHPALQGRVASQDQVLDIVYHAEMGLDEHIETIYRENDMDPSTRHDLPESWTRSASAEEPAAGVRGQDTADHPEAFVLFSKGSIEQRVVHDEARMEQRRSERELEALAQQYAEYVKAHGSAIPFDDFVRIRRMAAD